MAYCCGKYLEILSIPTSLLCLNGIELPAYSKLLLQVSQCLFPRLAAIMFESMSGRRVQVTIFDILK